MSLIGHSKSPTPGEQKVERVTKRLTGRPVASAKLIDAIERRIQLKAKRDEAQKGIDAIDVEIKDSLKDCGGCETPDWKAAVVESSNRHIDRAKLEALGVKPVIIAKATVEKEYDYIKVTVKK